MMKTSDKGSNKSNLQKTKAKRSQRDVSRSRSRDSSPENVTEQRGSNWKETQEATSQVLEKVDIDRANEKRRKCTVFVGNLSWRVEEDNLRKIFSPFGEIKRIHYPLSEETGKPKGFAFVEYTSEKEAEAATSLNDMEMWGAPIRVSLSSNKDAETNITTEIKPPNGKWLFGTCPFKSEPSSSCKKVENFVNRGRVVKVANVPDGFTEDETKLIFDTFGEIMMVNMIPHKREAYIHYYNVDHAAKAVTTMNGFQISDSTLGVTIDEMNGSTSSTLIVLKDLLPADEVDDELKDDIFNECQKYGKVQEVRVHIVPSTQEVRVFANFRLPEEANRAVRVLPARTFAKRKIKCEHYDLAAYKMHQLNN